MNTTNRRIGMMWLSSLVIGGLGLLWAGSGSANTAFIEQWLLTQEAAQRTVDGDCDPDETCLELCLLNPQTGHVIKQGYFDCFAN